jgi:hypothetical protein
MRLAPLPLLPNGKLTAIRVEAHEFPVALRIGSPARAFNQRAFHQHRRT